MADAKTQQPVRIATDVIESFGTDAVNPVFVRLHDTVNELAVGVEGSPKVATGLMVYGEDPSGDATLLSFDASGNLSVSIADVGKVDDTAFTVGADKGLPVGGIASSDLVDAGDFGAFQMTLSRMLLTSIYANTVKDGTGTDLVPLVDVDGHLQVDILSGGGSPQAEFVDDGPFIVGTDFVLAGGYLADEAGTDSVNEDDIGIARMTLDRKQLMVLVDATTDTQRLAIDANGSAQVSIFGSNDPTTINAEVNPIFVQVVNTVSSSLEVHDFDTSAVPVLKAASDNHDYPVTAAKTLLLKSIIVAASGAMKVELLVGPIAGLISKTVIFTSASKRTEQIDFEPPIEVPDTGTGTVRLTRTNDDNQTMDLYSTIIGSEV